MKKLALLLFTTLLFTGCGSKEELALKCSYSKEMKTLGYKTDAEYEVYAKDGYVTKVNSNEYVESDNEKILTTFEQTLSLTYLNQNNKYGGYTNKVSIDGNKLTSITNIDYSKVDLNQLAKDNSLINDYVKNGKLQVEGVKKIYEALGATCE